jgi:hypothetical protein
MIKVDKGVPLPPNPGGAVAMYPFAQMVPGDSFAVSVPDGKTANAQRVRLIGAAHCWAKRYAKGAQFATRSEDEGRRVRIWLLTKPAPLNPAAAMATPPVASALVHRLATSADEEEGDDTPVGVARKVKGKRY